MRPANSLTGYDDGKRDDSHRQQIGDQRGSAGGQPPFDGLGDGREKTRDGEQTDQPLPQGTSATESTNRGQAQGASTRAASTNRQKLASMTPLCSAA